MDDDLMRVFGSERIQGMVDSLGLDDAPIEAKMLTKGIENAQKRVEGRNFDIRKSVLQYDNVMNRQRELIYAQRQDVLDGKPIDEQVWAMTEGLVSDYVEMYTNGGNYYDDCDLEGLDKFFRKNYFADTDFELPQKPDSRDELKDALLAVFHANFDKKKQLIGDDNMNDLERRLVQQ